MLISIVCTECHGIRPYTFVGCSIYHRGSLRVYDAANPMGTGGIPLYYSSEIIPIEEYDDNVTTD